MSSLKKKAIIYICGFSCILTIISFSKNEIIKIKNNEQTTSYVDEDEEHVTRFTNELYVDEDYDLTIKEENISYKDIVSYKWSILKVKYPDNKLDVIMVRRTVSKDRLPNGDNTYYYKDVFEDQNEVNNATYNEFDNTLYVNNGPEILEVILLKDKLQELNLEKENYTLNELHQILQEAKKDSINEKELGNKSYVIKKGKIYH